MMQSIACEELVEIVTGRCGLVIGPGLSLDSGEWVKINDSAAKEFGCPCGVDIFETLESALESYDEAAIRKWLVETVGDLKGPGMLSHLAKAKWSGILSASPDLNLETKIEVETSKHPVRRDLSVVIDFLDQAQPRTVPCLKLLGSVGHSSVVCNETDYLLRKSRWRHAIDRFTDTVKGHPVLCVGMGDSPRILTDIATEFVGARASLARIIFLADDPVLQNKAVIRALKKSIRVVSAQGSLGDVVRAITEGAKRGQTLPLPFPDEKGPFASLHQFADVLSVVNLCLETDLNRNETHLLQDLLFSPGMARWDPFVYDMDFRRTVGTTLLSDISDRLSRTGLESEAAVVSGSSASGKTVVLKRLAFDLATAGHAVLWLRSWYYADYQRILSDLFAKVKRNKVREPIVIFVDDPFSYGTIPPREIVWAARQAGVDIFLVVASRTTDRMTADPLELSGGLPIVVEESTGDILDDDEYAALEGYLVKIGVAKDEVDAKKQMNNVPSRNTQDTLSTLYWLLPGTKSIIASSVREEYQRLGDKAGFQKLIIGTVEQTTDILKKAYELVAVSSKYRAKVPIEVLVRALGVDYHEWLSSSGHDGVAWGLLYAEEFEDGGSFYTTRNDLITQLITDTLNGGSGFGHHGELRVLGELIDACDGRSTPAYREFCVRLLVAVNPESESCSIDRFEYAEGLDLYERAIEALAFPDRTLVHHKGIWIRKKGKDPVLAAKVFQEALSTPVYPYAARAEADQHIHNSIATAAVDAIKQKKIDLDTGKSVVQEHLAKARSLSFFNPNALHVQGKHIVQIAKIEPEPDAQTLALVNSTLCDIDGALMLLKNPAHFSPHEHSAVTYLENIRGAITEEVYSFDKIKEIADELWAQHKNPVGMISVARFMFRNAMAKNNGSAFRKADDYCHSIFRELEKEDVVVPEQVYEIAMHVYFQWRVQRRFMTQSNDSIDWTLLAEYAKNTPRQGGDFQSAMNRYIEGVSLAHLGRWPEAFLIFRQLRNAGIPNETLHEPRGCLMNEGGGIRRVQGEIRSGSTEKMFWSEEIQRDFIASRRHNWPRDGEMTHAYIEFSFSGPKAVVSSEMLKS